MSQKNDDCCGNCFERLVSDLMNQLQEVRSVLSVVKMQKEELENELNEIKKEQKCVTK